MTWIEFRKYDGSPYTEFQAEHAGEDECGRWLVSPNPMRMRFTPVSDEWLTVDWGSVWLLPHHEWWTMLWRWSDDQLAVDVCMSPHWESDERVVIVDLDIDLFRMGDGSVPPPDLQGRSTRWSPPVAIVGEDLFETNRVALAYPDEVVSAARGTLATLERDMRESRKPFDDSYKKWRPVDA